MRFALRLLATLAYTVIVLILAPPLSIVVALLSVPQFWARLKKHKPKTPVTFPPVPRPEPASPTPLDPIAGAALQSQTRTQAPAPERKATPEDWAKCYFVDWRREGNA